MTVHIPVDMHKVFLVVIDYSYDDLSRLIEADYNDGTTVYNYGYDKPKQQQCYLHAHE